MRTVCDPSAVDGRASVTVSVLMPCYNAAPFVRAAIDSVLRQTWPDLELIVVNDGSTDGTSEVLAGISDPRLTIVHQENRGQCAAANRAYSLSRGEQIKFFDADDVLSLDHLAVQVARLAGRTDAVAMGGMGAILR
ncbi:MAG: glycosyltransferase family A protein [Hyphomonadaceae bacterium]